MNVQQAAEAANINSYQMQSSFGAHKSEPGRLVPARRRPRDWVRAEATSTMGYAGRDAGRGPRGRSPPSILMASTALCGAGRATSARTTGSPGSGPSEPRLEMNRREIPLRKPLAVGSSAASRRSSCCSTSSPTSAAATATSATSSTTWPAATISLSGMSINRRCRSSCCDPARPLRRLDLRAAPPSRPGRYRDRDPRGSAGARDGRRPLRASGGGAGGRRLHHPSSLRWHLLDEHLRSVVDRARGLLAGAAHPQRRFALLAVARRHPGLGLLNKVSVLWFGLGRLRGDPRKPRAALARHPARLDRRRRCARRVRSLRSLERHARLGAFGVHRQRRSPGSTAASARSVFSAASSSSTTR